MFFIAALDIDGYLVDTSTEIKMGKTNFWQFYLSYILKHIYIPRIYSLNGMYHTIGILTMERVGVQNHQEGLRGGGEIHPPPLDIYNPRF